MNITLHIKENGVKVYTLWQDIVTPIAQSNDYDKILTLKNKKNG